MKKLIWITVGTVLFLAFILPGLLALAIDMVPSADQPGYNPDFRLSIYGKREVSQRFVSKKANLTAIGTSIRNLNLKNKKEIILSLYDDTGAKIRTAILNGQNIEDGEFAKFVFGPIYDSSNKTYEFTMASPEAGPEETIEVFYNEGASDTILEYKYDEKTYPGGIPLVTFHKPQSKLDVIRAVYSRLLPLGLQKPE